MTENLTLSPVSETLYIPLYCRAVETQRPSPIIVDSEAVAITKQLDKELANSTSRLAQALVGRKLPKRLPITMALRARRFDTYVRDFMDRHENPVFVSMGCGLDTRFQRLDNGHIEWFDLDLLEVIALRWQYFSDSERYHMIASSVLDFKWIDRLAHLKGRPIMFLAEGLFMYLTEAGVKELVLRLQAAFPGSELVCEVFSARWVKRMDSAYMKRKFQKQLYLDEKAAFTFGISESRAMERWNSGITFVDDWTYFDDQDPRLGLYNWLGGIESLRKIQWVVHYLLR